MPEIQGFISIWSSAPKKVLYLELAPQSAQEGKAKQEKINNHTLLCFFWDLQIWRYEQITFNLCSLRGTNSMLQKLQSIIVYLLIIMNGNYQSLKLLLIGVINDQGVDRIFWCDDVSNYKLQKIGFCITMIMN